MVEIQRAEQAPGLKMGFFMIRTQRAKFAPGKVTSGLMGAIIFQSDSAGANRAAAQDSASNP